MTAVTTRPSRPRRQLPVGVTAALTIALCVAAAAARGLYASEGAAEAGHGLGSELLWIAIVLVAAKVSGLVERFGQPSVLGELVVGVILGNLVLVNIDVFRPLTEDVILRFLAELGVIVLLFQTGLESNLAQMRRVGARALMVAVVGVVVPFTLGVYIVGPLLVPNLTTNGHLFLGAALTATSVGITARVFRDLGKLHIPEAQIVLGAAVIDDVIGLIILAVVSAIATAGTVSLATVLVILAKAVLFLVGAIALGQLLAPRIGRLFSAISTGAGMKLTLALSFALLFAYVAGVIGLAPIVGAFAAGLVLDAVHFRHFERPSVLVDVLQSVEHADPKTKERVSGIVEHHSHRHVEELIEPIGHFLVPIFFVLTGMTVNLEALFDLPVLLVALAITGVAVFGKVVAGLAAGPVNKSLVGWGMVPRGEVGLIFATIGRSVGVLPDEEFSVIVIMVILTTLLTPPILTYLLKRHGGAPGGSDGQTPLGSAVPHAGAL